MSYPFVEVLRSRILQRFSKKHNSFLRILALFLQIFSKNREF
jgi:hypothetical protein